MKQHLARYAWLLSSSVLLIAIVAWLDCLLVPLSEVTLYDIFPLFGIVAFSLMWAHYITGVARMHFGVDKEVLARYFRLTSYGVLVALLLHPGLLIWRLWRDNAGLPLNYVAPSLKLYVVLGMIAWLAFMLFELHRLYKNRPWWHYVERASDVGMILILIHGYKLGCAVMPIWFTVVWVLYGVLLVLAIGYGFWYRRQN